jgi:hypothetical protein
MEDIIKTRIKEATENGQIPQQKKIGLWMICTHGFVQIIYTKYWENNSVSFHTRQERYSVKPQVKFDNMDIAYK